MYELAAGVFSISSNDTTEEADTEIVSADLMTELAREYFVAVPFIALLA
jgi:hypothetical protein